MAKASPSGWMKGVVKEAPSGDTLVIMGAGAWGGETGRGNERRAWVLQPGPPARRYTWVPT